MSFAGKLGWMLSLVLAIALAAMAYTFLVKGQTVAYADGRTSILLAPAERNKVLGEMRGVLSGVQSILEDAGNADLKSAAQTARSLGMAAASQDTAIIAKLPLDFKSLGLGLHRSFDDLADSIAATDDPMSVVQDVSNLMLQCVACHDSYRLGIEGEKAGGDS